MVYNKNTGQEMTDQEYLDLCRRCDLIFGRVSEITGIANTTAEITYWRLLEKTSKTNKLEKELEKKGSVYNYIDTLLEVNKNIKIPKWVAPSKTKKSSDELIPVIFITDIHLGEVVKSEETGVPNDYNSTIAQQRLTEVVDTFIDISKNKLTFYKYKGVVVPLGGDNITGNLHDLAEYNDMTPAQQLTQLTSMLIVELDKLKDAFGKVFVPAVTGNHSRLAKFRTKTKGRLFDSLEYVVYAFLQKHYEKDDDVTIVFSEADYVNFSLNGTRFHLEHGDSYRGGGGIGGIQVPIQRGIAKKRQVATATNQEFDIMIIGHFHQHYISNNLIIGNSIKGYDEFSKSLAFPYNPPGCTVFYVNQRGQIVFPMDLQCLNKESRERGVEYQRIF
jgi:hypothetical protein